MRRHGVNGDATFTSNFTRHLVDSDGCPNQFDLAVQYRWISAQHNNTNIRMDWTLNCACHGKGPSDGLGADVKGTINAEQMLDTADAR